MKRCFLAAVVALVLPCVSRAEMRTWSDITGRFQTEAEFVDLTDGAVNLKKTDGEVISVPLDKLSAADQAYVRRRTGGESPASSTSDALVEFLSGAKVHGRITARNDQAITVALKVGGRNLTRQYSVDEIRSITIDGRREVLGGATGEGASSDGHSDTALSDGDTRRSRAEIEQVVDRLGRTPPDWWDSTPLDYPQTLDLSWPRKAPPPWNPRKNVSQYLFDMVQPNSSKWRGGVRLIHHLLEMHEDDQEKRQRAMMTLGRLYYHLLRDYARAAFWWRQAGVERSGQTPQGVQLADCYWKLGNKQMALDLLNKNSVYYSTIKLLADMGETERALRIAEAGARGNLPDLAYLHAGDACRIDGQSQRAIEYYEKVLDVRPTGKRAKGIQRNHQRARENIAAIKVFDTLDLRRVPDGVYRARTPAFAAEIHVEVTVQGGRIEDVTVTKHQEKQTYTALTETPRKIIEKQGVKGVDATSGATITSEAIINATAKALASAIGG
ncbi:MAG: FMN-binding protein [Planctomycetes bacterium]|nr:FMN-binding protein [Planctomycetota bacterium]